MLKLFWKLFCHAGKYTEIGKCRPYVFNTPWRSSQMHELIQFETVSYGMRCVYVYTEFSFIKWAPSNFQLLAYANLMVFTDHISKLLTKIHILSNTCKTALNHCKHSITILISNAVLHKLALQGKQARLAGKASGHGSEQNGSVVPGTGFPPAHGEEGGKAKITCRALQHGEGTHTSFISPPGPRTAASQNCKSFQLPLALL